MNTSDTVFNKIKSGEMSADEFRDWFEEEQSKKWSEGVDVGQSSGY